MRLVHMKVYLEKEGTLHKKIPKRINLLGMDEWYTLRDSNPGPTD